MTVPMSPLPALLLSAPIGGYGPTWLFGVLLFVLAAVTVVCWRSGLRWVRRPQKRWQRTAGVVLVLVALALSLQAVELVVALLAG